MAKYLDLNGVKRLAGQLWTKVKALAAGKENVRLTKYVSVKENNSSTTLNFGNDYYVRADSTAVTSATLSLKLPDGWQSMGNTLYMDIMLRADSVAKINLVSADGFGIFRTTNFSSLNTKSGCHLHVTWFHVQGNSWGTMVCDAHQL